MTSFPLTKEQHGITLVELMIALAIGLFMTAIIAGLYLSMRGSFRYQEDFARLQENGRFAMDAITRDIRMAGYNGCGDLTTFANVVNGGSSSPFLNFATPVIGYEGGVSTFPSALTGAGIIAGTDAIVLLGIDPSNELVVQSHNPPSAQINTNTHNLPAGEILLITDCAHTAVFQMTGPASSTKTNVVHNTGTGAPGNCTKYLGASCGAEKSYQFKPGSSLLRIYSNAYFIAASSVGNGRSLYVLSLTGQTNGTPEKRELIQGVENMQITYGIDSNGDRSADSFASANSVADWSKVVSVRVSLLVTSLKDNISSSVQSYEYNGTNTTASDRKIRKVFTETATVRNRTP
ncbi:PilW family protein [Propionivibrio limicola]|uniref:PilW family protein n=1 Tax=Propionivibrio limicola TaxID=167645 RepID=UPI001290AA13|nr:PilW family protein [Propionivibrio limicola]